MSFRSAGFRPAVLGSALALALALSTTAVMAQEAPAPAASASAAAPAAASASVADMAVKPGDAAAGQAKAAVCGA